MSYYNTTRETGRDLKEAEERTSSQDREVLKHFKVNYISTPSQVWQEMNNILLTSVRRSISNLTKEGFLTKTLMKKVGYYGRKEYVWQYNGK